MRKPLEQARVDALPTGSVVTVLWQGFKSLLLDYRVENHAGDVKCTEVRLDGRWRKCCAPIPLVGVVCERSEPRKGTIVLLRRPPRR